MTSWEDLSKLRDTWTTTYLINKLAKEQKHENRAV